MSDSEHETDQETSPRFNKAIIGRICAVGVFIALGTFAVIQSMGDKGDVDGNKNAVAKNDDPSKADPNQTDPSQADPGKSEPSKNGNAKTGIAGAAAKMKSATGSLFPKSGALNQDKSKQADSKKAINPTLVQPKGITFNPALPPPRSFNAGEKKTSVVVTATPKAKPPERFAQAGGRPFIGASNGFQTRKPGGETAAPDPKIQLPLRASFGDSPKTPSQKLGVNKAPAKSTAQAAEDLMRKVSDEAAAAKKKITDGLEARAPQGQAKMTFAPPTAQTGFAGPPKSGANSNNVVGAFGPTSRKPNNDASANPGDNLNRLAPINGNKSGSAPGGFNSTGSTFDTKKIFEPRKPSSQAAVGQTAGAQKSTTNSNGNAGMGLRSGAGINLRSNTGAAQAITNNPKTSAPGPFGNRSTQGSTMQSPAFPADRNTQAKTGSSSFGNSNVSSSRLKSIPIPGVTATAALTKNTPGERQLEGVQTPALTIEKLSPQEIQVNTPADFQLIIKNVGRATAEDVKVLDQIPNGTQFLSASPEPNRNQGGDLQWNIGSLRPGQEKRIKIQLKPVRHGEIGSVAKVTFATQASMRTLVTKPVLEIVHQAKAIHLIGDDVMFDITVKNKGDGPATNVIIQEDVPKQLEFQDGSQGIEYEIGTLMPGQSRRIQLALKAAQIGKMQNIMFASADGGLQAKHELPLEVVAPNLVTKTDGPTIRYLQRNVTHKFMVANNGTAAATNVELIARLPSGLRFVSANNQGRYRQSDHSVFWSMAKLDRDVNASVELKTTPVEVGSQPIKFESFADLEVRSSVVQPLSVEHLVDVFIDIDDVVDPIEIGADTRYKVRVVNQGTKAATNVQLQVDFPTGLQPTSIDGSLRHQINGQRISFEPINSMSPGDEIDFIIHGRGTAQGDHRVVINMKTDGRQTPVSKEETTRVYSDR